MSASITIKVSDEGAAHHYRTEIPNIVDEMGISVYAFRLYAHLKRTAGDGGVCTRGYRNMAEKCCMSIGMVSKARMELVNRGLIKCTVGPKGPKGREGYHITICDLWAANMVHFAPGGPGRRTQMPITQKAADEFSRIMSRKRKHWAQKMKASDEVKEIAVKVAELIGFPPTSSQLSYWAKGAAELIEACGTDTETYVSAAVEEMRRRGLAISSPKSIVTTAQRLKAEAANHAPSASTAVYTLEEYHAD